MEETNIKGYKTTCSKCGKEFSSQFKSQVEYNLKVHELSCEELKEEKKDDTSK